MKSGQKYRRASVLVWIAILSGTGVIALRAQQLPTLPPPNPAMSIPLPDRDPARGGVRPHPGQVATRDWSAQQVQNATDRCDMLLTDTGVKYRFLAPVREGRCGAPAPIELSSIGKTQRVAIDPPARVTCALAATLSAWADSVLQPSARKYFGGEITHIRNAASYVCRNRYNAGDKPISEHARANALDMAAFKTRSGEWIKVLDSWALPPAKRPAPEGSDTSTALARQGANPDPAIQPAQMGQPESLLSVSETESGPEFGPASAFLYAIHEGACTLFGTVLGPEANEAHKDHFHYDLAKREHGAYCE